MDSGGFGYTDLSTAERVMLWSPAMVSASVRVFDEVGAQDGVEAARDIAREQIKGKSVTFEEIRRVKYHHGKVSETARQRSNETRKHRKFSDSRHHERYVSK
jgi:hypothetical protein